MKSVEQTVKDFCNQNNLYFSDDGYTLMVDTCDKRIFQTGNHWVSAVIDNYDETKRRRVSTPVARAEALRFLIEQMSHLGLPDKGYVCSDEEECEYCNEEQE